MIQVATTLTRTLPSYKRAVRKTVRVIATHCRCFCWRTCRGKVTIVTVKLLVGARTPPAADEITCCNTEKQEG